MMVSCRQEVTVLIMGSTGPREVAEQGDSAGEE